MQMESQRYVASGEGVCITGLCVCLQARALVVLKTQYLCQACLVGSTIVLLNIK